MANEKWHVTIPLQGMSFLHIRDQELQVEDAIIHQVKTRKGIEVAASVIVQFDPEIATWSPPAQMAAKMSHERVDRIATTLTFAYGIPIKPAEEHFVRRIEPTNNAPMPKWISEGKLTPVEKPEKVKSYLLKISRLEPEKRKVADKALALFREALATSNPLIAMILYFSSLSAILRDTSARSIGGPDFKKALQPISTMNATQFEQQFEEIYGDASGRCGVDHGWIDITDSDLIWNAHLKMIYLRSWTFSLIRKYIDENTKESH